MNYASHAWFPTPTSLGKTPSRLSCPSVINGRRFVSVGHIQSAFGDVIRRYYDRYYARVIEQWGTLARWGKKNPLLPSVTSPRGGRGRFLIFIPFFIVIIAFLFFSFLFFLFFFPLFWYTYLRMFRVFDGKFSIYVGGAEQHLHPNGNNALETVSRASERHNCRNNYTLRAEQCKTGMCTDSQLRHDDNEAPVCFR